MSIGRGASLIINESSQDLLLDALHDLNIVPVIASGNYEHIISGNNSSLKNGSPHNTSINNYYDSEECFKVSGTLCFFGANHSWVRHYNSIVVAASTADGKIASYSVGGPHIWISAPGGSLADPKLLTTDVTGCDAGYSQSISISDFERGDASLGNADCRYSSKVSGTSGSAALVSGAISDMVSVNRDLTPEQVHYILAKTARPEVFSFPYLGSDRDQGWQTNGSGLNYSQKAGFGLLDVGEAVDLSINCSSDPECYLRKNAPDTDSIQIAICSEENSNEADHYSYVCTANVPYALEAEHVMVSFDNLEFVQTDGMAGSIVDGPIYKSNGQTVSDICEYTGAISDLTNRYNELDKNQRLPIANMLRDLVIDAESSETTNRYLIKSRDQNFFGLDADYFNVLSWLPINSFYTEKYSTSGSVSIHFKSKCRMSLDNGKVKLRFIGYQL